MEQHIFINKSDVNQGYLRKAVVTALESKLGVTLSITALRS